MKIVYQGDIHRRDKPPVNRVDDYRAAQDSKLDQLVAFANKHEAHLFLGGDQADGPGVSAEIMNVMNAKLQEVEKPVYAILGQHDVPYHVVNMIKSPVYGLISSGAITHCQADGMIEEDGVVVHFVSWEKQPGEPVPGKFNIFLGHVSVFEKIPFYWKGEGYNAAALRTKYPGFDLYLCGDIHVPLVEGNVVVSGSMMRQNIDQLDAKPRCYLIDTETRKIEPLFYEIEKDVFRISSEKKEDSSIDLSHLVEAMKASTGLKRSYETDCLALVEGNEVAKTIIAEIFNELSK